MAMVNGGFADSPWLAASGGEGIRPTFALRARNAKVTRCARKNQTLEGDAGDGQSLMLRFLARRKKTDTDHDGHHRTAWHLLDDGIAA